MLAVDGGCDVMVEGERIPGEAAVEAEAMRRPARSSGDDRPTWADAAETGRGSRSRPPAPRFQAPVCLLRVGRARLPPQPRALAPARASPEKSQSRPHVCPLPERPGSQRARYHRKLDQWPVSLTGKRNVERDVGSPRRPTARRTDPPNASYQLDMATNLRQARRLRLRVQECAPKDWRFRDGYASGWNSGRRERGERFVHCAGPGCMPRARDIS